MLHTGDNHGMICVWEKDSGTVVQTLPLAHAQAVLSVSMSADGSTVASVGADNKVSVGFLHPKSVLHDCGVLCTCCTS